MYNKLDISRYTTKGKGGAAVNKILKILTDKLQEFIGEQPIEDDITIMILKRTDSSVVQELEPEELDFEVLEEIK